MRNQFVGQLLWVIVALLVSMGPTTVGQDRDVCDAKEMRPPKFQVAVVGTGKGLVRGIVVKPKHQTDENLVLLAKYFDQKYCKADEIIVVVFDNKKDARKFSINGVPSIPDTPRAMYYLNRQERKEKLVRVKVVNSAQVETPIQLR